MERSSWHEQTFFPDPAVDRVMGVVFNLAAEVQVLRERVLVLERLLVSGGTLAEGAVDGFSGDAATEAHLAADRRDYVRHVLEPVLGRAASRNDVEASRGR
jgi:hypothetical protein